MELVIVESPTKANTIGKFLGPKYKVLSSYGHVRDLPKSKIGVDIENDFEPKYIIMQKARKNITALKKEVLKAKNILISTDPDREGEAIAWHLTHALDLDEKSFKRIVFHEITKEAIKEALEHPRKIDQNLVNSQQARRILDRIVGYKLSPFLWKKVARGLSAGRVQSVALRLVVEREREIEKFVPQEYWSLTAILEKLKGDFRSFEATLIKNKDKAVDKLDIKSEKGAEKILKDLNDAEYIVENIEKKEVKKNPLPPFTTSTLQQAAWQKFRFPAKFTMQLAQQLYEQGFITYHRTDSLNLSESSLLLAKKFVVSNYGENFWAGYLKRYKAKGRVQEAHEAIRPAYADKTPESIKSSLNENQEKLYDLIWRRFIACQMKEALFDATKADIKARDYTFRANGQILKFEGFLKVYHIKFEETEVPPLEIKETLKLIKLNPEQHFTQPPPRYNEATLIKTLEENGIGRPSTYAPILSTIQERNYIEKDDQKRFRPTEIGLVVNDLLVNHFPQVVDIKFTAKMEEEFDEIAEGQKKWKEVLKEFYKPFEENLIRKEKEISKKEIAHEATDRVCPKCNAPLIIRLGRFGKFYACSGFPKCKYTESLKENKLDIKCPKCQKGNLTPKRTKKKKIFYGCDNYPDCDFALWDKPLNEKCQGCGSLMVETKRKYKKCSNKECNFKIEKEQKI